MAKKEEPKEPGITAKDLGTLWAQLGAMLRANNKATIEAAKNTAAAVDESSDKSKGFFKGLLSGMGGFFKRDKSKEKEKENEESRFRKMMLAPLRGMVTGMKNMASAAKEKGKAAMGGLKDMIVKGAMMVGVMALIAFVDSPLFTKLKTWVVDKLMPGMKKAVDIVVDIAKTVWNWVTAAVDWIVLAFTDPKAALDAAWSGIKSLGIWLYDNTILKAWKWIKGIFGFGAAEEKKASDGMDATEKKGLWAWIKAIPGAIWKWIKGLFGFSSADEKKPVEGAPPKTGWVATIIETLFPKWLIDFAKDMVGTVLSWIGITKKDKETGAITTTAMGTKIFGTIGEIGDILMSIIGFFIPDSLVKLIADPMGIIKEWFAPFTKDVPEGEEPKTLKDKIFSTIGKVGDVLMNILGFFIPKSLITFVKDPVGTISTWFTTQKAAAEKADPNSLKSKIFATIGAVSEIAWSVLKTFIPDALVNFVKDPLGIIKGWFAPFTKDVPKDQKPQTLKEKIFGTIGKIGEVFMNILGYWIPDSIIAFVKDPLGLIKQWFEPLTADVPKDQKPQTLKDKIFGTIGKVGEVLMNIIGFFIPQVIIDFVAHPIDTITAWFTTEAAKAEKDDPTSLKSKIFSTIGSIATIVSDFIKKYVPEAIINFVKDPLGTILGWIGITTPSVETKPTELADAKGKPEGGWFSAVLGAIFSPTLLLFLLGPVGWILGFLGFAAKAAGLTASTGDPALDAAKGKGEKNMFAKFLEKILPQGLIDFVIDPVAWVMNFVGLSKNAETGELTDANGDPISKEDALKQSKGIFTKVLKSILPDGLVDFIMSPVTWLLSKVGITKNAETGEITDAKGKVLTPAEAQAQATGIFKKVLYAILPDGLVDFITSPFGWILDKLGLGKDKSAEEFAAGFKMPTIKDIKDFLPKWLTDPIGWIKGFFGGGDDAVDPGVKQAKMDAIKDEITALEARLEAGGTTLGLARIRQNITFAKKRLKKVEEMEGGGFLPANKLAIVGEKGPELFMSKGPGSVIPNKGFDFAMNAFRAAAAGTPGGGGGGGQSSQNIIVNANTSNSAVANTKIDTGVGMGDPFTQAARAY